MDDQHPSRATLRVIGGTAPAPTAPEAIVDDHRKRRMSWLRRELARPDVRGVVQLRGAIERELLILAEADGWDA